MILKDSKDSILKANGIFFVTVLNRMSIIYVNICQINICKILT